MLGDSAASKRMNDIPMHNLAYHTGDTPGKKKILILAPFLAAEGAWIDDFCDRSDLEFIKLPYIRKPVSWHKRGPVTPLSEWLEHIKYVYQAMRRHPDCIVTSFPQLALVAAVMLLLAGRRQTRLVAWNFNLGSLSSRWKGALAGRLLSRVDRFVVHASGEIDSYARWLGLERERFRFIPLQQGAIRQMPASPIQGRYIVSIGSANRDYATLSEAIQGTGIKTVVISKREMIDQLPDHPDLIKMSGLTQAECHGILSGAELNIVPISSVDTASGQVTFITAMRLGVPTVATRCVGTVDYFKHGVNGLLVPPGDPGAMREAILSLWQDARLRSSLAEAGRVHAERACSDEAAGRHLSRILDEVLA